MVDHPGDGKAGRDGSGTGLPPADERRPGVYARLAEEAEVQRVVLVPPRWIRWAGWGICLAIAVTVLATALQVHPW